MNIVTTEPTITDREAAQIERANASSATPVVFVHGLWLLPSSWDRWVSLFEEAGYVGLTPGWPDDPETVVEAREHPEVFAGKGIAEVADYQAGDHPPAGSEARDHRSLLRWPADHDSRRARARRRVGRDQSCSIPRRTSAADPGAAHGQRRAAQSLELEPRGAAHLRAVPLQLRERRRRGRGEGAVPRIFRRRLRASRCSRRPSANINPWSEAKVDTRNPDRGPMLIICGRLGPHGSLGDRERVLQETEAQRGRDRDRQDGGPRAFADASTPAGGRSPGRRSSSPGGSLPALRQPVDPKSREVPP